MNETPRHGRLPYAETAASGRPRCRACLKEIPADSRRSAFCSTECAEHALIVSSGGYARGKVEQRDRGICAACGMDTEYVKALCTPYLSEAARLARDGEHEKARALRIIIWQYLVDIGFSVRVASAAAGRAWSGIVATHLWEMDHIVPVIRGGGCCGLDNLRTLCRACHHRETAHLAYTRAKDARMRKKRDRHAERMAMKARGEQLPLSRRWRR